MTTPSSIHCPRCNLKATFDFEYRRATSTVIDVEVYSCANKHKTHLSIVSVGTLLSGVCKRNDCKRTSQAVARLEFDKDGDNAKNLIAFLCSLGHLQFEIVGNFTPKEQNKSIAILSKRIKSIGKKKLVSKSKQDRLAVVSSTPFATHYNSYHDSVEDRANRIIDSLKGDIPQKNGMSKESEEELRASLIAVLNDIKGTVKKNGPEDSVPSYGYD